MSEQRSEFGLNLGLNALKLALMRERTSCDFTFLFLTKKKSQITTAVNLVFAVGEFQYYHYSHKT